MRHREPLTRGFEHGPWFIYVCSDQKFRGSCQQRPCILSALAPWDPNP